MSSLALLPRALSTSGRPGGNAKTRQVDTTTIGPCPLGRLVVLPLGRSPQNYIPTVKTNARTTHTCKPNGDSQGEGRTYNACAVPLTIINAFTKLSVYLESCRGHQRRGCWRRLCSPCRRVLQLDHTHVLGSLNEHRDMDGHNAHTDSSARAQRTQTSASLRNAQTEVITAQDNRCNTRLDTVSYQFRMVFQVDV